MRPSLLLPVALTLSGWDATLAVDSGVDWTTTASSSPPPAGRPPTASSAPTRLCRGAVPRGPQTPYLVGEQYDSPRTEYYKTISPVKTYLPPRGTVGLITSDGTQQRGAAGGDPVRILVTVPAFYSQFERQVISDAIEIAGLRPAGLVNDAAAIAVNYAMSFRFPFVEHHIIYDAGTSTATATLVSFRTVDANSTATKFESTIIEVKAWITTSCSELARA
ncbi:hypothetical protein AURDEDRAFT_170211 [Auricularia subglabra TFB-10046 SS5]|nr:hypothetical protein AURDEDRAFT_170211 [Auricularia subglabra TFB-10046 SS5]